MSTIKLHRSLFVVLVVLTVFAVGCTPKVQKPADTTSPTVEDNGAATTGGDAPADVADMVGDVPAATTDEAPKNITIALGSQNNSGQTGLASLSDASGKTNVSLTLINADPTVPQPAHIHIGSCGSLGGVKYPLNDLVGGSSETLVDVSMNDLLAGLPLAINAHKSIDEIAVYVACGDITK